MIKKTLYLLRIFLLGLILSLFIACDREEITVNDPIDNEAIPMGEVEIEFRTPHGPLKLGCVRRAELAIATNAENLYKGNNLYSFNVSDEQDYYILDLPPGEYYYQAGIICICETNSCSAGSFPGGQYGMKYTADKFYITVDETTCIVPPFH
ncbi:hypothetical protein ACFLSY_03330 [Bacteroidota bacterium]